MAILDNETDSALMVMELDAYEKILEKPVVSEAQGVEKLSEEELMEKINRDVAVWRAYNDKEETETVAEEEMVEQKSVPKVAAVAEIPKYEKFKPSETSPIQQENPPVSQEESANDIIAEEDEEKFYLEPVE